MNVLAAGHGWRDLAIWVMPPVAYALASDTAIGVVRARTIAVHRQMDQALADDATTPLAIVGGLALWLLRLAIAPVSTLSGFRAWVMAECPVAPGRRAAPAQDLVPPASVRQGSRRARPGGRRASTSSAPGTRPGSKTQRFLDLVTDRHGPLSGLPLADVSPVSSALAPQVGLDPGAARAALRRHVQAARGAAVPFARDFPPPSSNGSAS
jgi:hypothetical protein